MPVIVTVWVCSMWGITQAIYYCLKDVPHILFSNLLIFFVLAFFMYFNYLVIQITFDLELGDLPSLIANGAGGVTLSSVSETTKGTKENVECSNHGYCSALNFILFHHFYR